jgi:hypothetical protein
MITIEEQHDLVRATVFGELTLTDYREFEQAVSRELASSLKVKLLIDLTEMSGFTLDVAWEEIRFSREHEHDFRRIAVVTDNQWTSWLSWIAAAFTDAEVRLFDDAAAADAWLRDNP